MVKNSSQNGSVHTIIIICFVLALIGFLGFVLWKNIANPHGQLTQEEIVSDSKPDNWLIYDEEDSPISFYYPPNMKLVKSLAVSEINESVSIVAKKGNDTQLSISYRKGLEEPSMIAEGRSICHNKATASCVPIANDIATGLMYVGEDELVWTSRDDENEGLSVRSSTLDQVAFKKIVESISRA